VPRQFPRRQLQLSRYRGRLLRDLEYVEGSKLRREREKNGENGKSDEKVENDQECVPKESIEKKKRVASEVEVEVEEQRTQVLRLYLTRDCEKR